MSMKYINDIKTIDTKTGNTGIRIEVSENKGDVVVRAVNTTEFEDIKTQTDLFKKEGITRSKLKEEVDKVRVDAGTLETYHAKDFLKIDNQMIVGRVKAKSTTDTSWNYNRIEGGYNSYIEFDPKETTLHHGWCLIVRPGGYVDTDNGKNIPVQMRGYYYDEKKKTTSLTQYGFTDHTTYVTNITWLQADNTAVTEKCLICPVNLGWSSSTCSFGDIVYNYRGKTITRLWKFTGVTQK